MNADTDTGGYSCVMLQRALSVALIHDPQTTYPGPGSLSGENPTISVTRAFLQFITGELLNV